MKTAARSVAARVNVPMLLLALSMPLAGAEASITVNFEGIPDGTPVAAHNPYAGVVNLQGQAVYQYFPLEPGDFVHVLIENGVIQSGAVKMGVSFADLPETPPGTQGDRVTTKLTASFLEPVRGLTFETYVPVYFVSYQYDGVDQNGDPIQGSGRSIWGIIDPATGAFTTTLDAPEGGYFTRLELSNWAYYGGSASFEVNYLTLRGAGVPEPSALADKIFLGLVLAAAPFVRRGRRESATAISRSLAR